MTTELGIWQFPEVISDVLMHGEEVPRFALELSSADVYFQC
jgi:hypothetical protein